MFIFHPFILDSCGAASDTVSEESKKIENIYTLNFGYMGPLNSQNYSCSVSDQVFDRKLSRKFVATVCYYCYCGLKSHP